ncbi:MAG: DUF58 domain-containing protein [Candidatus Dormibacteraeota bacterium]|nr:DUF58 domain-containing protein [Candidatus Dormibacteraeota bacterium]
MSLAPQPRLLVALLVGALSVLLVLLSPLLWLIVIGYHAVLAGLVIADGRRLPGRRGFAASRVLPQPFSLGERQAVQVVVGHAAAAGLPADVADHVPADLRPDIRVIPARFDQEGFLTVEYLVQPPHRGAYQFGPVDVRCWRERGWLLRQVRIPASEAAAVYPSVLAIKRYQLTLRRGMRFMQGLRRARPPGATTAFAGLRDYLPGDEIRRISWKATARRDSPVVMEVEAERGQQAVIALDCGRLMTAPAGLLTKLDHAVNAALLLAWVAQSQGDRVGMVTFADEIRKFVAPQRGPAQVSQLNRVLYDVKPEYTEPDFGEAFSQLAFRLNRRSLVVVLTDVLDPEASRDLVAHAIRLSQRHLVMVVAMADPEVLAARDAPIDRAARSYEWAAAEELLSARRESFEALRKGGVLGLDVEAGRLSPALVERYLELKERALL